jgi:PAS domain S-box-containing protein
MIDTADPVMLLKEIERLSARVRDLESSGHRLQATLYGIGDGLIVTDVSGSVLQMNPTAEALTGWQESEARGLPVEQVFSIVDERTRRRVESPVTTILREGKVLGLANHALLISRDGRGIPIADSGSPIRDANGDISGVVFVFRDLTEEHLTRRYIETRLSLIEYASNHTLEALLTKALDEVGGFVDSPIGFYHFVDRDQKTLFLQQWSTRTLNEFCHAEGKGIHYPIDRAGVWVECVYQKKPVIHNDYAALPHKKGMPKGHAAVIRELVVPVMREDKVVAILGVGNKPTDYTDKDVDIVSYLADVTWEIVRQKLVEKDQEKLQHQLIQSQKMESLGRLAGGVAHDYNNILSVIVGYAELVMEKMTPGHSLREDLEEILKAAHRSHDFTRQLLVFARKETIVPEVLDLSTTVESLLKVLRRLIGENIHLV